MIQNNLSFVRNLIAEQFPEWADLPIQPLTSIGTDNAIYRLGEELAIRLPSDKGGSLQINKEYQWLPIIERHLPISVPTPIVLGMPVEDYPWNWTVYKWIDGEDATTASIDDPYQLAVDLGQFINALQRMDASDGPAPGNHNFWRGVPLAMRDRDVRNAVKDLQNDFDTAHITRAWEDALSVPIWRESPVWIHGDLLAGNYLVRDGKLCAVIDFGGLGVGDPACDWLFAWDLLSAKDREKLRGSLEVDASTWERARGWALSLGVIALPYHKTRNPMFANLARRLIKEVLEDYK